MGFRPLCSFAAGRPGANSRNWFASGQSSHFGYAVDIAGDVVLVGAEGASVPGEGAAYLFVRSGTVWSEEAELTASDGSATANDLFGHSVAVSGVSVVVGAEFYDHAGFANAGAVYAFRLTPPAPATYCTAGTSASGCQALLSASGTPSAAAVSGFSLQANAVEGAKDGMFFWGTSGQQAMPWGNGTSYQCIVPPVTRGGLLAGSGTSGACGGTLAQDLNAVWCSTCPYPQKNPGAGAVVQAQLWYRDPLSTSNQTTSLSDAIEFFLGP